MNEVVQPDATARTTEALSPPVPSAAWRMLASRAVTKKLPKGLDAAWDATVGLFVPLIPRGRRFLNRAARIVDLEDRYGNLSQGRLRDAAMDMRDTFRLGREDDTKLDHAFAIVREVARRELELHPYLEQVAAGLALYSGCITEMATGEGKTLAATMPATIAGWRGRGCHVVTVNDYLAKRDAEWMRPIYKFCGLQVAHVEGATPPPERRRAYDVDITYLTNKEVAADFLRDRLALGRITRLPSALLDKIVGGRAGLDRLVMRGLEYAIVDEADSILIDEAVTPLIISGSTPNSQQIETYVEAAEIAAQLAESEHFRVDHRYREVTLTPAGRDTVHDWAEPRGGIWRGARRREELIVQALTARHLYQLGKQYVLQEGKVVIVDEFTGRLMPDRTWRDGMHQAVEAKEKLEVQPPKDTLARISFQRFFRGYRKLSGMTGTAWEGRHEFWQIYHLPTVRIPTHKPCIRIQAPNRIFDSVNSKWRAIVSHIQDVHATGRPILVGTRSVRASEHLSGLLSEVGLEHYVLNAVRHAEEAKLVANAGLEGRITVATNMAGRGTDIKLGRGVQERGGLHVLTTELHESGRIDRQLYGRAARQGDAGSAVAFASLEDELIVRYKRGLARKAGEDVESSRRSRKQGVLVAQRRAEDMALRQRKQVLKADDWLDEFLGFAGREV